MLEGEALIQFRKIVADAPGATEPTVLEYRVSGDKWTVVDIPPGYTHSIENLGEGEMVTLFWSSEVFDPSRPDTYFDPVLKSAQS